MEAIWFPIMTGMKITKTQGKKSFSVHCTNWNKWFVYWVKYAGKGFSDRSAPFLLSG